MQVADYGGIAVGSIRGGRYRGNAITLRDRVAARDCRRNPCRRDRCRRPGGRRRYPGRRSRRGDGDGRSCRREHSVWRSANPIRCRCIAARGSTLRRSPRFCSPRRRSCGWWRRDASRWTTNCVVAIPDLRQYDRDRGGAASDVPSMPEPPDAPARGRAALHLWSRSGDVARLHPAAGLAKRAAGLFRHQFHAAGHRYRASDRMFAWRSAAAAGTGVASGSGGNRGDRTLHLARPRDARRGARRECLRAGRRRGPCRAVRHDRRRPRCRAATAAGRRPVAGRAAHAAIGDTMPGLGSAARGMVGRQRLLRGHHRSHRLHRQRAFGSISAADCPGRC